MAHHPHDKHNHNHSAHGHANTRDDDTCCAAPEPASAATSCATGCCSDGAFKPSIQLDKPTVHAGSIQTPIRIMQMDCPTEEGLLRKKSKVAWV